MNATTITKNDLQYGCWSWQQKQEEVLHKDRQKNVTQRSSLDVLHQFYFPTEYPLPLPGINKRLRY